MLWNHFDGKSKRNVEEVAILEGELGDDRGIQRRRVDNLEVDSDCLGVNLEVADPMNWALGDQ